MLWFKGPSERTAWTIGIVVVAIWIGGALLVRQRMRRPLRTLSNMIGALREQDYSLRARNAETGDALGLALWELNELTSEMHDQRLGALEATALFRRVMAEIDVAVFAFDGGGALRVVNAAGARLFGQPDAQLLGRQASELGLADCLSGTAPRIVDLPIGPQRGRWELRRGEFRQDGHPHRFLVLADVSRTLREQERVAWQQLVRVLSHEINNSITPISSLTERLRELVMRDWERPALRGELERGLGVVASRSAALSRFLAAYAHLSRLPAPHAREVRISDWIHRVARLESRVVVRVVEGPDVSIDADGDQLDQLLINLITNAVDATDSIGGSVSVSWCETPTTIAVSVVDDGPGLAETTNLFVPFFTTKPGGSGIGLVLSRQIAEAHGGSLVLANRAGTPGCEACLVLPRA